jgi:hypothetical protein
MSSMSQLIITKRFLIGRQFLRGVRSKELKVSIDGRAEQGLAADGAIACFSINLFPSARMLIARRS